MWKTFVFDESSVDSNKKNEMDKSYIKKAVFLDI